MNIRIGFGIDFHQLVPGRALWIGGVEIPSPVGALGHSDADVLLHAICDACLGAAALGDIGVHFPDSDPTLKGIDSKLLLQRTMDIIRAAGFEPVNIDSTVCLEAPRIKPFVPEMCRVIAEITGLAVDAVSIKATSTEKMGFIGRGEGLSANAVALLERRSSSQPPGATPTS